MATNKEMLEEILTVLKSLVDLLVVDNKRLPHAIDYNHEKDIDIKKEVKKEDLQEVHDDTKPEVALVDKGNVLKGYFGHQTEKALMFTSGTGLIAWVPKKAIKGNGWYAEDEEVYQELELDDWCEIKWKKEVPYGTGG